MPYLRTDAPISATSPFVIAGNNVGATLVVALVSAGAHKGRPYEESLDTVPRRCYAYATPGLRSIEGGGR